MKDVKNTTPNDLWRPSREDEVRFWVDAPFTRSIVEDGFEEKNQKINKGDVIQSGYSSTWVRDRDEEYVDPRAFDDTLPTYLSKNPIMLWQHESHQPIGQILDARPDETGLGTKAWQPRPHDNEPDWKWLAYESVRKGIVRTHSIGGYFQRAFEHGMVMIKRIDLMEISTVSIPSNPESIVEAAVKSIKGPARPELTPKHVSQMMQVLGCRPMSDPELMEMNENQLRERFKMLAAFYKKTGRRAPEYEEWNELAKDVISSKGLEAMRDGTSRTIAFMKRVNGYEPLLDETKAGRVISKANEEKLGKARELIDDVIGAVNAQEE